MSIDVVFVTPNSSSGVYQDLANEYAAIEPPTWSLLLAESCRSKGFSVKIIDANAENINEQQIKKRILDFNPRILCFVIYGQNVNAGTTNMSGAVKLSNFLKKEDIKIPIVYVGSHVQALPLKTLNEEDSIDIVCTNEGVYSIHNLLKLKSFDDKSLETIKGIGFRFKGEPILNPAEEVVPQEKMDIDLPGYAWDLLPYKSRPFDLYRSPMWHAEYIKEFRSPYAALQTSLGCQFGCNFCMINIINRNDNDEIGVAANYSKMRYWSTDFIIKEFKKLIIKYGIKTIRIVDEMFLLNPKYYIPLCEKLSSLNKDDSLRMWAYSRVDTIKRKNILSLVRKAGIKWLCLGIESGSKKIRLEVSKGKFEDVDVKDVVNQVHESDINIMANYIYGLPGDDTDSIKKTFDLSVDLNTLGWNTYAAMALPGSQLYKDALKSNVKMPENYEGYSFHSYNTQPLPTEKLSAAEVLKLRDEFYIKYHTNIKFLEKIEKKFGLEARNNIKKMTEIRLKRKIIEEQENI